ncbi:MAG: NnrU family protein [Geminicoccales bacterium]
MVPNGDLAHIILFGSFALTALLGMVAFDHRTKRRYEDKHWRQVLKVAAFLPCGRGFNCRGVDRPWLRGLFGILLYATILALHAPLIGVSPR